MGTGAAALGRAALVAALVLLYYGFSIGITFYNKWLMKVRGGGRRGGGRAGGGSDGGCRSRRASRSRCSPRCCTSCSSSRCRRCPAPWCAAAPGGRRRRCPGPSGSAGPRPQVRAGMGRLWPGLRRLQADGGSPAGAGDVFRHR